MNAPVRSEAFGGLLREFRRERGFSQVALAERSGVASRAIGALENAERSAPRQETVRRLAAALELERHEHDRFERAAELARPGSRRKARTHERRLAAIPAVTTPTFGRESNIDELCALLERHRLVTLTGFGGIGKSRVALEVARRVGRSFDDGAAIVDCAHVASADLLARDVARGLSLIFDAGEPLASLAHRLQSSRMLLVLDNCERVTGAASDLVRTLNARCPGVTVLVTSRHRLMLSSEFVYRLGALAARSASRYFLARTAHEEDGAPLEGIPVSIEIAAGTPALERHRSAAANLDWSYGLLDASERAVLQRLAAFERPFDGDEAEAACATCEAGPFAREILAALVEKSLVNVTDASDGSARYSLFGVTRAYAARKRSEAPA